jgi:hypothetical protein
MLFTWMSMQGACALFRSFFPKRSLKTALHLRCIQDVSRTEILVLRCKPVSTLFPRLILRGYFRMRSHVRRACLRRFARNQRADFIRPKLSDSLALHPRATPRSNRLDELRLTVCSVGHVTVSSARQDVFSEWSAQVQFHWLILPDSTIIGRAWSRAFERGITCLGKLAR